MKKILLFTLAMTIASTLFSQNDEDVCIPMRHFYLWSVYFDENDKIDNDTYVKRLSVDDRNCFQLLDKSSEFSIPDQPLEPWDSIYYANRRRLTFYFEENYYKKPDTTHISDINDMSIHECVGSTNGVFINGKKEGLWEKYYFSRFEGKYVDRKVIEESYKEGVMHGVRKVYGLDGNELGRTLFVNGTGDYYDFYYDSGKMAVSGFMVYGKRHGDWTYYNKTGNIIRTEYYKHGLLHGPLTIYDDSGNVIFETNFKYGTGEYRHYRNGIMKEHGKMINGRRIGMWNFIQIGSNSLNPNQDSGIRPRKYNFIYKEENPGNDTANIIDYMFYDGEYVYLRALKRPINENTCF